MEKQKRWQLFLILAVIFLTTYNILPTVLYYLQPLDKPINSSQATKTVHQIVNRTTALEKESVLWLESFSKLLSIKPASITLDKEDPQLIQVAFKTTKEADTFRSYLPRAGALIPFVPSQLSLTEVGQEETSKTVTVSRKVGTYFTPEQANDYFTFSEKFDAEGKLTPFYRKVLNDRLTQLSFSIGGASENAQLLSSALHATDPSRKEEFLMALCHNLKEFVEVFGESSSLAKRAFASVTQGDFQNKSSAIDTLIADLETFKDRVRLEKIQVQEKESHLKKENSFLTTEDQQRLEFLIKKEELLASTVTLLKNHTQNFAAGLAPWSYQTLPDVLAHSSERDNTQTIKIGPHHPFINALVVDFDKQSAALTLHSDVVKLQTAWSQSREKASMKDRLEQLLFNEIARIARESNETIQPSQNQFEIALSSITDSQSFLAFDLTKVASDESVQLKKFLEEYWHPKHPDLRREVYPIWDYATYQNLPVHARQLGLVVCTPSMQDSSIPQGMKTNSIYVIAKGMDEVFKNAEKNANAPEADLFMQDFQNLQKLLRNKGYYGYPGTTYPLSASFAKDFIFESENLYSTLLTAFRENFHVFGTKKYAVLEFSNTKQRIYALNQIENSQQEDLLKWRDDYQAARVNPNVEVRFDVPKPVYSPLWRNFVLSFKKYFRGDERKVLHWGLDLSGGKTVQIELRDQNGHKVTNPADLAQGVNELYNRVNKMGLSEVSIREHGSNIILDFPGAQGLSATELVKASSMYFHVVNETFTPNNAELAQAVNRFLQDIWNEAVVTNKKDIDSVNRIAWKHLYGESLNPEQVQPRSDAAKLLYDHGLRFPLEEETVSSNFGETYSKIALLRGDNFTEWFNQSHPLLIVFNNYALEGANLTNVHSSYDPSKGNFLAFDVKGSYTARDGQKMNPRTDLFAWTSAFSKEKIVNTASEK
ncbi:MAG: protein translocase subunit SecDF, partial [Chlamydiae bacterium]|nr:protein translocase subunit SecDF [Chlamydiota bacterium]